MSKWDKDGCGWILLSQKKCQRDLANLNPTGNSDSEHSDQYYHSAPVLTNIIILKHTAMLLHIIPNNSHQNSQLYISKVVLVCFFYIHLILVFTCEVKNSFNCITVMHVILWEPFIMLLKLRLQLGLTKPCLFHCLPIKVTLSQRYLCSYWFHKTQALFL